MERGQAGRKLAAGAALLLVASFVACANDNDSASLEDGSAPASQTADGLTSKDTATTAPPAIKSNKSPAVTVTSTPGYVAKPPKRGREAEPSSEGPLRFDEIRISKDPETGEFLGQVNVMNRSDEYLNDVQFDWSIVAGDEVLDGGRASWPNLAPGETATVRLDGSARYDPQWEAVRFDYVG